MGLGQRATGPRQRSEEAEPRGAKTRVERPSVDAVAAVTSGGEILSHRAATSLQQVGGNRATRTLVQAKLTLGPADDQYEQEADRVAGEVMRHIQRQPEDEELMAKPIQRQPEDEELMAKPIQRQPEDEELMAKPIQRQPEDEELLQGKAGLEGPAEPGPVDPAIEQQIQGARSGGEPLDSDLRSSMEGAFGADFGAVRVHTGQAADALNASLQARAFTTGSDIFFRNGDYAPGTRAGQELIAHELTHVVQQGAAATDRISAKAIGVVQRARGDKTLGQKAKDLGARALSKVFGPLRGATSLVGGTSRLLNKNWLTYYNTTTRAGLSVKQRDGLDLARQHPTALPADPAWLDALLPGTKRGEKRFNSGRRKQWRDQWATEHKNNHWFLPGVKGAGGYNEYGSEPEAADDRTLGRNRILRQTNDPTGTYWWASSDHYSSANNMLYITDV